MFYNASIDGLTNQYSCRNMSRIFVVTLYSIRTIFANKLKFSGLVYYNHVAHVHPLNQKRRFDTDHLKTINWLISAQHQMYLHIEDYLTAIQQYQTWLYLLYIVCRWTWRLIHMKSIWNHILITSHKICLNYISYCELHMKFTWILSELVMNFIWNEIKFVHMKSTGSSYEIHKEFK